MYIILNLNFSFLFFICIQILLINLYTNKNNINTYFNISISLIVFTFFLFYYNLGAYAGFLFLCELIALFAIYIILNKTNYILYNKKNNIKIKLLPIVFTVFIQYVYFMCIIKYKLYFLNTIYVLYFLNTNDFFSLQILFYSNYYNVYLFVMFSLIIITALIITSTKIFEKFNNNQNSFKFYELFTNNNYMNFKNNIYINIFKKICLIVW